MNRFLIATALILLTASVYAQPSNPSVRYVSVAPTGACSASPPIQVVSSTGVAYTCNNGTWGASGGGGGSGSGIWQRATLPIVDAATMTYCENSFGEFSGGTTSSPQILTGLSSAMWLVGTCGATSFDNVIYGESGDGIHFTWSTTTVISGYAHGFMFKNSGNYYYVGANMNASTGIATSVDLFQMTAGTFPNGTWTKIQTGLVTTSGPAWHNFNMGNVGLYPNPHGSGFLLVFEGDTSSDLWHIGVATLTNLSGSGTVAEYAGNPVISNVVSGGICGGVQSFQTLASGDYLWPHCTIAAGFAGTLEPFRFKSTDGADHVWTQDTTGPALPIATVDEGLGLTIGGIGNPFLISFNGLTYFYYQGDVTNGTPTPGQMYDKVAITPLTLAQIVATQEGNGAVLGDYTLQSAANASGPVTIYDDFTRTNATLTAPWIKQFTGQSNALPSIVSDLATCPSAPCLAAYNVPISANQKAQVTMTTLPGSGHYVDLIMRNTPTQSTANGYICLYQAGTGVRIYKQVAGTTTQLTTNPTTYTGTVNAGDMLSGSVIGTVITCSVNNIPVLQAVDSAITTGNYAGFFFDDATAAVGPFVASTY